MATVAEKVPFEVVVHQGNVYLDYEGTTSYGVVQPYRRPVGPENPVPGTYCDALGVAVLKLLRMYEKMKAERDEYMELLQKEPVERPRKRMKEMRQESSPSPEAKAV